jgi:hypothetical protein
VVVLVVPPVLVLVAVIPALPVALLPPTPVPVALLPPTPVPVALLPPTPVPVALLPPTPVPVALELELELDVVLSIWHTPARQTPPAQGVLSGLWIGEHTPLTGLQSPTSHSPTGGQTSTLDPLHVPAWHVSVCVQASPSLHDEPLAFAGVEQTPVATSQVPAS